MLLLLTFLLLLVLFFQVLGGDHAQNYTPGISAYKTLGDVLYYPGCSPETCWLQLRGGEPVFTIWCGANFHSSRSPTDAEYQWLEIALRAVVCVLPQVKVLDEILVPCDQCAGIHELGQLNTTVQVTPGFRSLSNVLSSLVASLPLFVPMKSRGSAVVAHDIRPRGPISSTRCSRSPAPVRMVCYSPCGTTQLGPFFLRKSPPPFFIAHQKDITCGCLIC